MLNTWISGAMRGCRVLREDCRQNEGEDSVSNEPISSDSNSHHPLVFMRFCPAWASIDGIRGFARFFCETTSGTPDLAERAPLVVQETPENAVNTRPALRTASSSS